MTQEKTLTMKDFEGKKVFLRPTGNTVNKMNPNKIIAAKIVNVARVYATVDILDESPIPIMYRKFKINGIHLSNSPNSGYQVFSNKQEIDDLLFIENTARKIVNSFQYARDYKKLDRETITQVANLLGIQIGD